MKIVSTIHDKRINSTNLLVEITVREYVLFAKKIIKNNDLQRLKVKSSKTVYSLLKDDLLVGCIMPAIVLAITDETQKNFNDDSLEKYFIENTGNVIILDGLQRTYTLIDALSFLEKEENSIFTFETIKEEKKRFLDQIIRIEVYTAINKFGILYRMLTLNTGQTPMSTRHQLELLYNDYSNIEVDGIKIVSDIEGTARPELNQFVFKSLIEGFNSYINRDELPMDRQEMLENLKVLEKITKEDLKTDIFKNFLSSYTKMFKKLRELTNDESVSKEELSNIEVQSPFGTNVSKIFSTSQAMTGFGAAIGTLKDKNIINNFSELDSIIDRIECSSTNWLLSMIKNMDLIKKESKRIGNGQRLYFKCFFKALFNKLTDTYCNLDDSVVDSYTLYKSMV